MAVVTSKKHRDRKVCMFCIAVKIDSPKLKNCGGVTMELVQKVSDFSLSLLFTISLLFSFSHSFFLYYFPIDVCLGGCGCQLSAFLKAVV